MLVDGIRTRHHPAVKIAVSTPFFLYPVTGSFGLLRLLLLLSGLRCFSTRYLMDIPENSRRPMWILLLDKSALYIFRHQGPMGVVDGHRPQVGGWIGEATSILRGSGLFSSLCTVRWSLVLIVVVFKSDFPIHVSVPRCTCDVPLHCNQCEPAVSISLLACGTRQHKRQMLTCTCTNAGQSKWGMHGGAKPQAKLTAIGELLRDSHAPRDKTAICYV
jgi:hypothetical protein